MLLCGATSLCLSVDTRSTWTCEAPPPLRPMRAMLGALLPCTQGCALACVAHCAMCRANDSAAALETCLCMCEAFAGLHSKSIHTQAL